MARLALIVLLLANAGYFAWSQGWLRDFGLAPEQQGEPQRIAQQIRPEALRIVAPGNSDEAAPDASAPPVIPATPIRATTVDAARAPPTNPRSSASRPDLAPPVPNRN